MIIKSIRLKNIKVYSDAEIDFYSGVNFIRGKNGAGKSTIIEAIGFALFDSKNQARIEDMISFGKKEGEIEVCFNIDGSDYRVKRTLSRKDYKSSWHIFNEDSEVNIHGKNAEIKEYLADVFKTKYSLETLFEHILGAYQGKYKYPLEETRNVCEKHFDLVFGTEKYRQADKLLLEPQNLLTRQIEINDKDIEHLSVMCSGTEQISEQIKANAQTLIKKEKEFLKLAKEKEQISGIITKINDTKQRLALANNKFLLTGEQAKNLMESIEQANEYIAQKKKALGVFRQEILESELLKIESYVLRVRKFILTTLPGLVNELKNIKTSMENTKKIVSGECPVMGGACIRTNEVSKSRLDEEEKNYAEKSAELANILNKAKAFNFIEKSKNIGITEARELAKYFNAFCVEQDVFIAVELYTKTFYEFENIYKQGRDKLYILKQIKEAEEKHSKDLKKHKEIISKLAAQKKEADRIQEEFLKIEDNEITAKSNSINRQYGILETQVEQLKLEIARDTGVYKEKREFAAKLYEAEQKKIELSDAGAVINNLRLAFRNLGPKVADMLRETISQTAANIYADMVRDGSRFYFNSAYEVELNDIWSGLERKRTFKQLSGGEKMSCAIVLRLSLLNAFSRLKIGFFDEPTENLDMYRKEALAASLGVLLKNLEQVFIISHDNTFDSLTENIIDVESLNIKF